MKVKIQEKIWVEKEIFFEIQEISNELSLKVRDASRDFTTYILTITKEGYLQLHTNVNERCGLKLDKNGRIIIKEGKDD